MSNIYYVNGKYANKKDSLISVNDRSLQFSDSIYEVIGIYNRRLLFWDDHIKRLELSLGKLGINFKFSVRTLEILSKQIIRKNSVDEGILYIQISRGISERNHIWNDTIKPSLIITSKKAKFVFSNKKRVSIVTDDDNRWLNCDIKSTSLLANVLSKNKANLKKSFECWLVNKDGFITEGSSSNSWIIKNKKIYTTPTTENILSGVTRKIIIKCANICNLPVLEQKFTIKDAYEADEAFLSSTSALIIGINKINNKTINPKNNYFIVDKLQKTLKSLIINA